MANPLKPLTDKGKAKLSFLDAGIIAVTKPLIEGLFNMVGLGNGNVISAGVKVLGGGLVSRMGGNVGSLVGTSAIVSGVDDVVSRFLPALSTGQKSKSSTQVVGGADSNQGNLPGAII